MSPINGARPWTRNVLDEMKSWTAYDGTINENASPSLVEKDGLSIKQAVAYLRLGLLELGKTARTCFKTGDGRRPISRE